MKTNKKILIVDDEEELCILTAEEFEEVGFEAITAHTGRQATELLCQHQFDLVLMDVNLPDISGMEVLGFITKMPKRPPVIFASGFTEITEEEAVKKGALRFFLKPVSLEELVQTASQIVSEKDKWSREHQRFHSRLDVQLSWDGVANFQGGKALNISRGGMYVELESPMKIGDALQFKIVSKNGLFDPIQGKGNVRWSTKKSNQVQGFGLQFESLDENSSDRLWELVSAVNSGI